ncbi:hypothetical protein HOK68_03635 [Candidatus Woesearchaeota archaeon]|jgi:uncharacterized protein|nr:hypothetical protein [Candidatus Woesearchaeota archaeon]MBT4387991.1 hypothetical protein [Candidatus Woesearchaeota archaeon]MBT4595335.1 hypothetical protein [Candidatus Woesearchaeota archaeon]MBT5741260.1 hypothetical protein [Candidatus Woesearchaeota archaeon]MBT6505844.1 hypothetical protein [Candidatus Woesearchaeota archaeon]
MIEIIIDTNFWTIPFVFRVDILEQIDQIMHEPYNINVLEDSLKELNQLKNKGSGKDSNAAKMALSWIDDLIKRKALKILKVPSNLLVDDQIIKIASTENVYVATQDKELSNKLKKIGTKLIKLRQKNRLEIINKE